MEWQSESDITKIFELHERKIGQFFRLAVNEYVNDVKINKVLELLAQGRVREALAGVRAIAEATANATQLAFLDAADKTSEYLFAAHAVQVGFDRANSRAVAIMGQSKLELVQGFTDKQIRATQAALKAGIEDGMGPRAMARQFRGSIGLTAFQQGHVDSYRRSLDRVGSADYSEAQQRDYSSRKLRDARFDRTVERRIREGRPLSASEKNRMVDRYQERYLKFRSENIARTEALRAVHAGQKVAVDQVITNGVFTRDEIRQKWNTHRDGRQRHAHDEIHNTMVPWGEPWENSEGTIYYPGDPSASAGNTINCRCIRTIRTVRVAKALKADFSKRALEGFALAA